MTEPRAKSTDSLVSLRDYFESHLTSHQRATDLARELMESRLERAEVEMERRLDVLNHLRSDMMTKVDFTAQHAGLMGEFRAEAAALRSEVAALKEWKAEQRGKASVTSVYLAYGLSVAGLLVSAITLAYEMVK